jgi:two-component system, OmpR family, response regulator AdeR
MPRHRILIADDDRLICELVANAIRSDGHEAAMAHNGARALALLRERAADLLILDADMPVMDGFGVLQAMRSCQLPGRIPVLMLTRRRAEVDVLRARRLGAVSYVLKPFVVPMLLARAYALIGAPQLAALAGPSGQAIQMDGTEWID